MSTAVARDLEREALEYNREHWRHDSLSISAFKLHTPISFLSVVSFFGGLLNKLFVRRTTDPYNT